MKKLITTLAIGMASLGLAYAGNLSKAPIEPKVPVGPGLDCFGAGFEFSGFGGGMIPDSGSGEMGGGAALSYFFDTNIGVEFSYAVYAFDSAEHLFGANLVYRVPIADGCLAPYLLLGGGLTTNNSTNGFFDIGAGLDIRFDSWSVIGIFIDGTYNWVSGAEDFTQVRTGFRIPF